MPLMNILFDRRQHMYLLGETPDYAPPTELSAGGIVAARGVSVDKVLYDMMLQHDGRAVLYMPSANYNGHSQAATWTMLNEPNTVIGFGDGGAHYGVICDGSFPTT